MKHTVRIILFVVVISATALYSATLMRDVANCASRFCEDSGEFQIALAEGGTVHPTGYPLYMLLGTPFVRILDGLGISAAAAGSLYSLAWQVLAVTGVFGLIYQTTRHPWLAGAAALALAVTRSMWLHGTLAEVYSLSMALTVLIFWLAIRLHARWSPTLGWWLAFAAGLGVAHHRLIAVMLPAIGLWLLPQAWRGGRFWRWLGVAALCFATGFLPYLDIPLRAWRGATWLYNQANTWPDFWRIFWGSEYLRAPNHTLATLATAAQQIGAGLAQELGWAGLALALFSALFGLIRAPRQAGIWWAVGLSYLVFTLFISNVMIEAKLLPLVLCLVAAGAIGLAQLPRRWPAAASGLVLVGTLALGAAQYPVVSAITLNHRAETFIRMVEQTEAPPGAIIMGLWGQTYFDLYYAQHLEGRLKQWQVVDHRADVQALTAQTDGRIYLPAEALYVFTPDEWRQRLGTPLRFTSAGPGMLAVTAEALPSPAGPLIALGDGLALAGWEVRALPASALDVVLYWTATRPVTADYSTYVHVSDQEAIATAADLLGQDDSLAPVYGWYPTSQWLPGEVIREDHVVSLPAGPAPRTIVAGLYHPAPDGQSPPLDKVTLHADRGGWVLVSP